MGDATQKTMGKGEVLQLERKGYFIVDRPYESGAHVGWCVHAATCGLRGWCPARDEHGGGSARSDLVHLCFTPGLSHGLLLRSAASPPPTQFADDKPMVLLNIPDGRSKSLPGGGAAGEGKA